MIIRNKFPNKIEGFTLLEIICVIVITAIIAGVLGNTLRLGFNSYFTAEQINNLAIPANLALLRMASEIRSATTFTTLSSSQLAFTTAGGNTIQYNLSGSIVTRSFNGGTGYTLTNNVSLLQFNYFDYTGNTTSTAANVELVTIKLTLTSTNNTSKNIITVYPRI